MVGRMGNLAWHTYMSRYTMHPVWGLMTQVRTPQTIRTFTDICCRDGMKELFLSNPPLMVVQSCCSVYFCRHLSQTICAKRLNSAAYLLHPFKLNLNHNHRRMCACPDLGSNAELVFMRPWDMAFVAFNPLITPWPQFTPSLYFVLSSSFQFSIPLPHVLIFLHIHSHPTSWLIVKSPSVTGFSLLTWQVNSVCGRVLGVTRQLQNVPPHPVHRGSQERIEKSWQGQWAL